MTVSNGVTTARKLDGKIETNIAPWHLQDSESKQILEREPALSYRLSMKEEDTASKRKNVKMVAKANDCARREGRAQGWVFCGR
jgi:hypothetical protein